MIMCKEDEWLEAAYEDRFYDDDLRDYAEEAYNRNYCDYHGTSHTESEECEIDPENL